MTEWSEKENEGLDPAKMSASSRIKTSWVCKKGHCYEASVASRVFNGSGCPYCSGQKTCPGENDHATLRPDLLELWDIERNGSASDIVPGSHRNVWWKCRNGHTWKQKVYVVASGSGCPYCAGYYPVIGETDLATTHPQLAAEWDIEKNGDEPSSVSAGSSRKVWWKCELGHRYEAMVYARLAGTGCPYCTGKKVLVGFNDLLTTDPESCKEWDADKNELQPTQVNRGSHKKVWWRCELGHSYESVVYAHVAGNGCPYCSGRKVLVGFNDLATTYPLVAAQWAQEYNGSITPEMVTKGSNRKYWWRCSEGHYWQAPVFSRTRKRASDCPVCAGKAKIKFEGRYRREDQPKRTVVNSVPQERPAV